MDAWLVPLHSDAMPPSFLTKGLAFQGQTGPDHPRSLKDEGLAAVRHLGAEMPKPLPLGQIPPEAEIVEDLQPVTELFGRAPV